MKTYVLNKYECARIIGIRVAQLNMSATILVNVPAEMSYNFLYVAALELKSRMLDLKIRRPMPMNTHYDIHINECDLPAELDDLIAIYEKPLL